MIISGNGTINSSYWLELYLNEGEYRIPENDSPVDWQLTLYSSTSYFSIIGMTAQATINGSQVLNEYAQRSISKNSSLVLGSGRIYVPHNDDGTKKVDVSASLTMNATDSYVPGNISISGQLELTTIPRYANFTEHYIASTGLDSITVKWNADVSIDYIQYSLNGGNWVDASGMPYIIYGLQPNTQYSIRTRIRRTDSQLWTESGYIYGTTKDIARVVSAPNINLGDNAIINISNPSGVSINYFVELLSPYKVLLEREAIAGNNTIVFTDEELDEIFKNMGKGNSIAIRFGVTTNKQYWDWLDRTCTLTGNQKTGHRNINGSWKRTKRWININGSWKRSVRWVNINGSWKRCI